MGIISKRELLKNHYIINKLYRVFLLILLNVAFISSTWLNINHVTDNVDKSGLTQLGINTCYVYFTLTYVYALNTLIFSLVSKNQKTIAKLFLVVDQLGAEGEVLRKSLHLDVDYQENKSVETWDVLFILVIIPLSNFLDFYVTNTHLVYAFGFCSTNYFANTFCTCIDYTLIRTLRQIAKEFRLTRDAMEMLLIRPRISSVNLKYNKNLSSGHLNANDKLSHLKSLIHHHKKCVALSGQVNKLYSLQSFFSIALSFALVITFLFLGSLLLIQKARGIFTNSEFIFLLSDVIIMIVIHLVKLMYLISVCNKTRTQADKIMQLGRKVIIEDKCPELTYEFIGAATTYWVIMVQFQLTSPS
ncbi:hypothetical protein M8J76_004867 [Diaphorina citri]|nr:hypothetical protein M8J76_004867 [Diaphorina citri]